MTSRTTPCFAASLSLSSFLHPISPSLFLSSVPLLASLASFRLSRSLLFFLSNQHAINDSARARCITGAFEKRAATCSRDYHEPTDAKGFVHFQFSCIDFLFFFSSSSSPLFPSFLFIPFLRFRPLRFLTRLKNVDAHRPRNFVGEKARGQSFPPRSSSQIRIRLHSRTRFFLFPPQDTQTRVSLIRTCKISVV